MTMLMRMIRIPEMLIASDPLDRKEMLVQFQLLTGVVLLCRA